MSDASRSPEPTTSEPDAPGPVEGERGSGTRSRRSGRGPSMADVAHHVGVSHQTVSRVLNNSSLVRPDTRERVLAAIETLGYRRNAAARALVTNRSNRIGVITAHLGERGPAMIVSSLQDATHAVDHELAMVGLHEVSPETLRDAVDRLLDQPVDAIVVSVTHREALSFAQELRIGIPVVLVEGVVGGDPLSAGVAQREGGEMATRHLLDLGHRSVAHVSGPLDWVEATERREGWLAAHRAAGRPQGRQWAGDWTASSGYAAGREIAADPEVTGVFVANDQMALGVLLALREAGCSVPGEVSVVGFDDLPETAFFSPPLTSVRQDFNELARRAVDLVVRALDGEESPSSDLVGPTLVVRDSTAAPPPGGRDVSVHTHGG